MREAMWLPSVDLSSVLLFAVTFLVLYVVYRSLSNRRYPPSLPWLPVVGSLPFMGSVQRLPMMYMQKAVKIGNVFSFYAGSQLVVVINGRDAIHEALVTRATDFADRELPFIDKHYTVNRSQGLVLRSYGSEFKKYQHKSLNILKEFGFGKRIMETRIATEVSNLVESIREQKGRAFNCQDTLTTSVMNIIYSILFGSRQDPKDPKYLDLTHAINNSFMNATPEFNILPILRFLPSYKHRLTRTLALRKELMGIINSCIKTTLESETSEECFVHSFGNNAGEETELVGIIRDLIIAGSETTMTTLRWSLVALANHPQVQERLQKEIDGLVPGERFPTLDDKPNLPYVEASLLELMRWRTLAPLAVPHKTLCDTEAGGCFIPKDTRVIVNLYSAHMDPRVWKDPQAFRPERFLDDNRNMTGKNLVIPFSLGKRSCLGEQLARQELFLFFTGLLQHFDIRPPEGHEFIDDTENFRGTISPLPFKVRFIPRNLQEE